MSDVSLTADAPIHVVPYDPSWPMKFAAEKALLSRVLSPWLEGPIEHVGSTAVAGLFAKPVIDIMAGVKSLPASAAAKDVLGALDYQYADYKSDVMHWFCKPSHVMRTHHLHLVPYKSQLWTDRLAFRNLLRSDKKIAAEYAALKIELASRFEFDREGYTQAKSPFIHRQLANLSSAVR
jgi:GrpB-like predicted nucleotidyltransferase (UPF0157 family)